MAVGVLDGDRRLIGEGGQQLGVQRGEGRRPLGAKDDDAPDGLLADLQRQADHLLAIAGLARQVLHADPVGATGAQVARQGRRSVAPGRGRLPLGGGRRVGDRRGIRIGGRDCRSILQMGQVGLETGVQAHAGDQPHLAARLAQGDGPGMPAGHADGGADDPLQHLAQVQRLADGLRHPEQPVALLQLALPLAGNQRGKDGRGRRRGVVHRQSRVHPPRPARRVPRTISSSATLSMVSRPTRRPSARIGTLRRARA